MLVIEKFLKNFINPRKNFTKYAKILIKFHDLIEQYGGPREKPPEGF